MSNNDPSIEEKVARLAAEATDRDPVQPPAPIATDGFFWRTLDKLGSYAAYAALALLVLAFGIGLIGGADFGWAGFLGIPALVLFIFYILYLMRRRQQNRAAEYLTLQQEQERARLEVARLVLEQSQQEKPTKE